MVTALQYKGPRSSNPPLTLATHTDAIMTQGSPAWGTVRTTKPPMAIVTGTHQAFPGITKRPDGSLYMVWRSGSAHVSFDGIIRSAFSVDKGRTWSTPVTIVTPAASTDLRDPSVSMSADGTKMWLTYFKAVSGTPGAGVFFRLSTDGGASWGSEVRVDATIAAAAVCAPVIELDSSTLMIAYYGHTAGQTFDSVYIAKSTTDGASWTNAVQVNGTTDSRDYQEPVGVKRGNTVILFYRYGNAASIGSITSTNNATSWGSNTSLFVGQGRSNPIWFSGGTLAVVYRQLAAPKSLVVRYSRDGGSTWYPPVVLSYPPPGGMMTYADLVEINPNQAFMGFCEEVSTGATSTLYGSYLTVGGGSTPLGNAPGDHEAVVDEYDSLVYATRFDQPNGTPGDRWTVRAGTWSVTDGVISNATSATVGLVTVDYGLADVEIEADLRWDGSAGVGILARYVDANNFCYMTVESASGTPLVSGNFRLYAVVGGTGTQLAVLASATAELQWHKFRFGLRGATLFASINGSQVLNATLTSAQMTAFGAGTAHGFRFFNNNNALIKHQCRRFLMRG